MTTNGFGTLSSIARQRVIGAMPIFMLIIIRSLFFKRWPFEITLVVMILLILFSFLIINYNPVTQKASARDKKRISDLSTLDRAINEYMLDTKAFPDLENTLRISTLLPDGGTSVDNAASGWIQGNLSEYTSYLPIDPINDAIYRYSYIRGSNGYELNAKLESMSDEMLNDGGNDSLMYEAGSNLNLISP